MTRERKFSGTVDHVKIVIHHCYECPYGNNEATRCSHVKADNLYKLDDGIPIGCPIKMEATT